MAEKREVKRKRKRLKLKFGLEYPKRLAFSEDLSLGGLFVTTRVPERPGKYLMIQIILPNDKQAVAYGQVQWTNKLQPAFSRLGKKKEGMGVRLTGFELGEEDYKTLLSELGC